MEFNYIMTRNDLKKLYMKFHQKTNIMYIIICTFIYFFYIKDFIKYNILTSVLIYLVVMIFLILILYIFNLVYSNILIKINDKKTNNYGNFKVILDKHKIVSKSEYNKLVIEKNEIKNIKINKNIIYIKYENEDNLLFIINKDFLKNKDDFIKISNFIKNNFIN